MTNLSVAADIHSNRVAAAAKVALRPQGGLVVADMSVKDPQER